VLKQLDQVQFLPKLVVDVLFVFGLTQMRKTGLKRFLHPEELDNLNVGKHIFALEPVDPVDLEVSEEMKERFQLDIRILTQLVCLAVVGVVPQFPIQQPVAPLPPAQVLDAVAVELLLLRGFLHLGVVGVVVCQPTQLVPPERDAELGLYLGA